jgi:hypothetical protein
LEDSGIRSKKNPATDRIQFEITVRSKQHLDKMIAIFPSALMQQTKLLDDTIFAVITDDGTYHPD